tara:strand:- start:780 stop:1031 length:252 start_codon:yes stop_codon:yes gene_type:complete
MMKPQTIRLLDVFAIGPLMIWGGMISAKRAPVLGYGLALTGAATVLYNGLNYVLTEQVRRHLEHTGSAGVEYGGIQYEITRRR